MKRSDWWAIVVIGAAVGLLSQPILGNVAGSFHLDLTLAVRTGAFIAFTVLAPLAIAIADGAGLTTMLCVTCVAAA